MTGEGLVGRVAEVGERTARILLLTDLNSHIPGRCSSASRERAVLAGDNSDQPRLLYLPAKTGGEGRRPHRHRRQRRRLPAGIAGRRGGVDRRRNGSASSPMPSWRGSNIVRIVDFGLSGVPAAERRARAASRARGAKLRRRREPVRAAMRIACLQRDVGVGDQAGPVRHHAVSFVIVSVVPLAHAGLRPWSTPSFALMAVFHWTIYRPDLLPLDRRLRDRPAARSAERHALCRPVGADFLLVRAPRC